MADLVDLGLQGNCDLASGIVEAYFFKQSEVATITFDASTREVTGLAMSSTKEAYKVAFNEDEAQVNEDLLGGFGTGRNTVLNFTVFGQNGTIRTAIQGYDKTSCLAALVIYANGKRKLLGIDFDSTDSNDPYKWMPKQNGGGSTSGTVRDTGDIPTAKYTRNYTWYSRHEAPFVSSAFDLSVFITPVA